MKVLLMVKSQNHDPKKLKSFKSLLVFFLIIVESVESINY